MEMSGIGREVEKLGIGQLHALVNFFRALHHFVEVIVDSGLKTHLIGCLADEVEAFAHGAKRGVDVLAILDAAGRKNYQVLGAESLEKAHGFARVCYDLLVLSRIIHPSAERNGNYLKVAL